MMLFDQERVTMVEPYVPESWEVEDGLLAYLDINRELRGIESGERFRFGTEANIAAFRLFRGKAVVYRSPLGNAVVATRRRSYVFDRRPSRARFPCRSSTGRIVERFPFRAMLPIHARAAGLRQQQVEQVLAQGGCPPGGVAGLLDARGGIHHIAAEDPLLLHQSDLARGHFAVMEAGLERGHHAVARAIVLLPALELGADVEEAC
ncbi:MAG: hypothetical protein H6591_06730 [Flavobacteriales bacterium]|nr:hypothetical protein [Flavobacteriales bacterium]